MTQTYDTLMDCLATLAVEAVQSPVTAMQVYWLTRVCETWHAEPSDHLTWATLGQHGQVDALLPMWARPVAPRAFVQLLQQGIWLQGCGPMPWLTPANATWESLSRLDGVTLRLIEPYQPYVTDVHDYAHRLWEAVCRVHGPRPLALRHIPAEVLRGAVLFEAGCYFACHEYFETLWDRVDDAASAWYQGLIHIAVAMRHLESHNVRGATRLLQSGLGRLQRYPAVYKSVDLTQFQVQCTTLLQALQALPNAAAYRFDPTQVPRMLPE